MFLWWSTDRILFVGLVFVQLLPFWSIYDLLPCGILWIKFIVYWCMTGHGNLVGWITGYDLILSFLVYSYSSGMIYSGEILQSLPHAYFAFFTMLDATHHHHWAILWEFSCHFCCGCCWCDKCIGLFEHVFLVVWILWSPLFLIHMGGLCLNSPLVFVAFSLIAIL